jgi:hypothetical protein
MGDAPLQEAIGWDLQPWHGGVSQDQVEQLYCGLGEASLRIQVPATHRLQQQSSSASRTTVGLAAVCDFGYLQWLQVPTLKWDVLCQSGKLLPAEQTELESIGSPKALTPVEAVGPAKRCQHLYPGACRSSTTWRMWWGSPSPGTSGATTA